MHFCVRKEHGWCLFRGTIVPVWFLRANAGSSQKRCLGGMDATLSIKNRVFEHVWRAQQLPEHDFIDFDETWSISLHWLGAQNACQYHFESKSAPTPSNHAWNAQVTLETQSKCVWKHGKQHFHVFLYFYFKHPTFWKNGPILRNASNVARTFTFRDWSLTCRCTSTTILAYLGNIYGSRILMRNSAWNHLECGLNYACGFAFYKLRMRCRTKYQQVWLRRSGKILLHTRKTREQRENYDLFLHVLHHLKKAQVRNPNTRLKSMA